jgi:peptidoglycan/xylan/chitin deacetylase (PgdA/CDA1 family)
MLEPMPRWFKRALKPPVARLLELRTRLSGRHVGLALCYHRVSDPEGDLERDLVPAMGTKRFEAQVAYLRRHYRLVTASQLADAVVRRRPGQRIPVAITFDDDLRSHVTHAMPILRRLGAPATFFLCGASLESAHEFWWERLQRAWDRGLVDGRLLEELDAVAPAAGQSAIRHTAAAIQRLPPQRREALSEQLASRLGPDPPDAGLRGGDAAALAEAGFEIAFHTLRHDSLPALDDSALAAALAEGRTQLEEVAATSISTIAYPHGSADRRVAAAARAAGYRFGFAGCGGAVTAGADPLLLDRRYPHPGSRADFAFDVARALRAARRGGAA